MKLGIPKETVAGENRVATTPDVIPQLKKLGYEVIVERGAGSNASLDDEAYRRAGAVIAETASEVWNTADIILKVRAPVVDPDTGVDEAGYLHDGQTLICFFWPAQNEERMKLLAAKGINLLSMDSVPRVSRAQKLDALSSMANIAGYRAVVEAANQFGRFFTGQITAAGKVPPAKVMVIGAGVAGLSAIGTAGSLGAIVRAFDTRPEVKEQVESMGAEFLELEFEEDASGEGGYAKVMSKEFIDAEMALFREQAREVDIIITTALIPGKPAPELITVDMVESMRPGSVVVDLAAEQGGNCALTEKDRVVIHNGVKIIGYTDLTSRLATQASQLYATNIRHLLTELTPEKDGEMVINMEDVVIRGTTSIKGGEITWPPPAPKLSVTPPKPKPSRPVKTPEVDTKASRTKKAITTTIGMLVGLTAILWVGSVAPASFMPHFIVFVLACFVGWQVVWAVTPALHTPLMSVTNAISGIIVIGALLKIDSSQIVVWILAAVSILIATVNVVGGFLVTQRMLKMFRK
ncbi:MAG: NAD(P) transhydrogenase subunit alpha [marine bacterium B5-7]|nr:MAG: NAD(P) transhydrogenase subunit alpha [marine bacterium B5-7]